MKGYFSIWGCYQGSWEKIDSANSYESACYLLQEYSLAFGRDWQIEIRQHGKRVEF